MRRVVFDLETEPFSEAFGSAKSLAERVSHAPRLRLACAYLEDQDEYRFYEPESAGELVELLLDAEELISLNGNNFDLPVLARHHGLYSRLPRDGEHVDLLEIMESRAGFRVSLDKAVRWNFGETKHTQGREMTGEDPQKSGRPAGLMWNTPTGYGSCTVQVNCRSRRERRKSS